MTSNLNPIVNARLSAMSTLLDTMERALISMTDLETVLNGERPVRLAQSRAVFQQAIHEAVRIRKDYHDPSGRAADRAEQARVFNELVEIFWRCLNPMTAETSNDLGASGKELPC